MEEEVKRKTRIYTVEIVTKTAQGTQKDYHALAMEIGVTFIGINRYREPKYRIETRKRILLNEKGSAIKKYTNAQKIALQVAGINDELRVQTAKSHKLLKVLNTDEIREKWQSVKLGLQKEYPTLLNMITDFDWQLEEENIQQLFLADNFYNVFFSTIIYPDNEGTQIVTEEKTIANAIGTIAIPIIEEKKVTQQYAKLLSLDKSTTIHTSATINTEHPKFPLEKLNVFLSELPVATGDKHMLDFDYKGYYQIQNKFELITEATLCYNFEVKDLYKKEISINIQLEKE